MKVNEIFASIDGEGSRAGYPATFIRLYDCNLRCGYCDTMYAVEGGDYREMSVADILAEVNTYGLYRITLTGGEPLLREEEAKLLLTALVKAGYEVNIETNGAVSLEPFESLRTLEPGLFFYTIDYKSLSSGMNAAMNLTNFQYLKKGDIIKFVVGDEDDLEDMKRIVTQVLPATCEAELYVSPVFDEIEAADIVDFVLNYKLENIRVQLQLHKYIWDPNMRGV